MELNEAIIIPVESGTPQRSVLGRNIFLLCLNDLSQQTNSRSADTKGDLDRLAEWKNKTSSWGHKHDGVRVISDENKSRKVGIETPTQFSLARKHEAFLGSETLFLADH